MFVKCGKETAYCIVDRLKFYKKEFDKNDDLSLHRLIAEKMHGAHRVIADKLASNLFDAIVPCAEKKDTATINAQL